MNFGAIKLRWVLVGTGLAVALFVVGTVIGYTDCKKGIGRNCGANAPVGSEPAAGTAP
jgi:hypothetical protein